MIASIDEGTRGTCNAAGVPLGSTQTLSPFHDTRPERRCHAQAKNAQGNQETISAYGHRESQTPSGRHEPPPNADVAKAQTKTARYANSRSVHGAVDPRSVGQVQLLMAIDPLGGRRCCRHQGCRAFGGERGTASDHGFLGSFRRWTTESNDPCTGGQRRCDDSGAWCTHADRMNER